MSRIPSIDSILQDGNKSYGEVAEQYVLENGSQYEKAFSGFLMDYVKEDPTLKNFYIRFIYECEIIKIVIDNHTKMNLSRLNRLVTNMENATTVEVLAIYDSEFHHELFDIAGREDFFDWFTLQSQNLTKFLGGFWKAIGFGTEYYKELLSIHREIYNSIEQNDKAKALEMMERHFAILLFQLLGTMFSTRGE